jgi:hypothetical protein
MKKYSSVSTTKNKTPVPIWCVGHTSHFHFFGWCQAGWVACQAKKMACKPFGQAWAYDPMQIPARYKPFGTGTPLLQAKNITLSSYLCCFLTQLKHTHTGWAVSRNYSAHCHSSAGQKYDMKKLILNIFKYTWIWYGLGGSPWICIMIWAWAHWNIFEYNKLPVCCHGCHPAQVGPLQFTCGPVKVINVPVAITLLYIIYQLDFDIDVETG